MKRSKCNEERALYAPKQAESGTPVGDDCRQLGISEATCQVWKKKFAELGLTELRALQRYQNCGIRYCDKPRVFFLSPRVKTWQELRGRHLVGLQLVFSP